MRVWRRRAPWPVGVAGRPPNPAPVRSAATALLCADPVMVGQFRTSGLPNCLRYQSRSDQAGSTPSSRHPRLRGQHCAPRTRAPARFIALTMIVRGAPLRARVSRCGQTAGRGSIASLRVSEGRERTDGARLAQPGGPLGRLSPWQGARCRARPSLAERSLTAGGRCCAAAETPQDHAFLAVDDRCRRGTSEAPLTT